jgi:hypothetical protein
LAEDFPSEEEPKSLAALLDSGSTKLGREEIERLSEMIEKARKEGA